MTSPMCPWCGDEVSDSPGEDFPPGTVVTECGGCGRSVMVSTIVVFDRMAQKIETLDDSLPPRSDTEHA